MGEPSVVNDLPAFISSRNPQQRSFKFKRPTFAEGSAELTPGGREDVDALARALAVDPKRTIAILGAADGQGDMEKIPALARARAETIRSLLVAKGRAEIVVDAGTRALTSPGGTATGAGPRQDMQTQVVVGMF